MKAPIDHYDCRESSYGVALRSLVGSRVDLAWEKRVLVIEQRPHEIRIPRSTQVTVRYGGADASSASRLARASMCGRARVRQATLTHACRPRCLVRSIRIAPVGVATRMARGRTPSHPRGPGGPSSSCSPRNRRLRRPPRAIRSARAGSDQRHTPKGIVGGQRSAPGCAMASSSHWRRGSVPVGRSAMRSLACDAHQSASGANRSQHDPGADVG